MDAIFKILLQIWLWQQCVPVTQNIIGYHTVNVHYAILKNAPVLVYLIRRKINIQQTRVQQ